MVMTIINGLSSPRDARVRRNSEKLGVTDKPRKRLEKKAASTANLLTRSPSLEKWDPRRNTHSCHHTATRPLTFSSHISHPKDTAGEKRMVHMDNNIPFPWKASQVHVRDWWVMCVNIHICLLSPQSGKGSYFQFRWRIFYLFSLRSKEFPNTTTSQGHLCGFSKLDWFLVSRSQRQPWAVAWSTIFELSFWNGSLFEVLQGHKWLQSSRKPKKITHRTDFALACICFVKCLSEIFA